LWGPLKNPLKLILSLFAKQRVLLSMVSKFFCTKIGEYTSPRIICHRGSNSFMKLKIFCKFNETLKLTVEIVV
jgi:hypothetical protein